MVPCKAKRRETLEHILDVIFDEEADRDMHKIIVYNKFRSTHDIITINDKNFGYLQFLDNQNKLVDISKSDAGLLRMFKAFVAYCNINNITIQDNDWLALTQGEFDNFCVSSIGATAPPPSAPPECPAVQTTVNLAQIFKCGIKHAASHFTAFNDDSALDNLDRGTIVQTKAQDTDDVLHSATNLCSYATTSLQATANVDTSNILANPHGLCMGRDVESTMVHDDVTPSTAPEPHPKNYRIKG